MPDDECRHLLPYLTCSTCLQEAKRQTHRPRQYASAAGLRYTEAEVFEIVRDWAASGLNRTRFSLKHGDDTGDGKYGRSQSALLNVLSNDGGAGFRMGALRRVD